MLVIPLTDAAALRAAGVTGRFITTYRRYQCRDDDFPSPRPPDARAATAKPEE
jgi:hypothetical protein